VTFILFCDDYSFFSLLTSTDSFFLNQGEKFVGKFEIYFFVEVLMYYSNSAIHMHLCTGINDITSTATSKKPSVL